MNSWKEPEIDLIPLFWQYADDGVREVLAAAEDSLKDLFNDLHTRYNALKIQTCDDYKPELMRPMYIRVLTDDQDGFPEAVWSRFKPYQKKFFRDRYFLCPSDDIEDTGAVWECLQEMTDARSLYCGGRYLEADSDFQVVLPERSGGKAKVVFVSDPFTVFSGYVTQDEITSPWRTVYRYRQLVLWASDLKMTESVIDTHYTDLISDKNIQAVFRDAASYSVFVYNFYKVLYQGATVEALDAFVNSLSGWAYTLTEGEKVQWIEAALNDASGTMQHVVTDCNEYWVPLGVRLNPKLVPGVALPQYTPIGESIVVRTYLEDPEWIFRKDSEIVGYLDNVVTTDGVTGGRSWSFDFSASPPHHPRFDFCRQTPAKSSDSSAHLADGDPRRHFQSLEEGLWHNVVGPNLVFINFLDGEVYEKYEELFYDLFLELAPVHVYCYLTHELTGWFFFDPELTDETGVTWFTDEDWAFIEDPEKSEKLHYELSIYRLTAEGAEDNVFGYTDVVTVTGRAPSGCRIRLWLTDSDSTHDPWLLEDVESHLQTVEIMGDGVFEFKFKIVEDFAPRDAVLRLERVREDETMPEWYVTTALKILPHTLCFDNDAPEYAMQNHEYSLSGRADGKAAPGLAVTVTWPYREIPVPGEPVYSATVYLGEDRSFIFTIPGGDEAQPPLGTYGVHAEIVNGTRNPESSGDARFIDSPAVIGITCLPTIFDLATSTQYRGAGLRNDADLEFPVQQVVAPVYTLTLTSPVNGAEIQLGSEVTIAGTTDFADGSTVTIKSVVSGTETTIGTATVAGSAFSYTWTAAGNPGTIAIKAVCNGIEDSVDVTLAAVASDLSIDSDVQADTPTAIATGEISMTSILSADTPTNV